MGARGIEWGIEARKRDRSRGASKPREEGHGALCAMAKIKRRRSEPEGGRGVVREAGVSGVGARDRGGRLELEGGHEVALGGRGARCGHRGQERKIRIGRGRLKPERGRKIA